MKQRKTAAQLARMIEERMTLQASVSIRGQGSEWLAGAAVFGFGRGADAERQVREISDDLRSRYEIVHG